MIDKPLSILILTQYFWPENMRINDLVEGMVGKGHEVTVLTGVPNYPEGKTFPDFVANPGNFAEYSGARVFRVPLIPRGSRSLTLALNYLSFFVSASTIGAYKLRGQKFDAVFVYAVSPILAAIPALVIGKLKKAPTYVWVLDLWPETLSAVGVVKSKKALAWVGRVVSWIYNRTDYILVQSQGFVESVKVYSTREIPPERIVYLPSWAEDDFSAEGGTVSALVQPDADVFTIVFAGNIGEAQDFPAILRAAEALVGELPVRWVIVGDGRAYSWVKEIVAHRKMDNVLLLGRHPLEKMPPLFAVADALLVSLRTNDVFAKTIPGKVQAYLASGRPVIAMIDGEAARVIEEAGAGMVCESGDADGLAGIVRKMYRLSPDDREQMGVAGRKYYLESFSKDILFDRLETLFKNGSLRRS
ncbi:glycosyltransferase WbuB [Halopseudomonas laoshanensis]|uniref:Glycosyltransferase WbuB n=1 Tax=Halopseudomonas laoshanensis TaxID=2268758 RepID=A0A7V7GNS6_9GAMM|nr:glycosyltransferase family 4 protein [Halopseudomonas laoshanensis]KAA0690848.1 glycosyltransferase WbuB [Halopseudomonas laoshanensis]